MSPTIRTALFLVVVLQATSALDIALDLDEKKQYKNVADVLSRVTVDCGDRFLSGHESIVYWYGMFVPKPWSPFPMITNETCTWITLSKTESRLLTTDRREIGTWALTKVPCSKKEVEFLKLALCRHTKGRMSAFIHKQEKISTDLIDGFKNVSPHCLHTTVECEKMMYAELNGSTSLNGFCSAVKDTNHTGRHNYCDVINYSVDDKFNYSVAGEMCILVKNRCGASLFKSKDWIKQCSEDEHDYLNDMCSAGTNAATGQVSHGLCQMLLQSIAVMLCTALSLSV